MRTHTLTFALYVLAAAALAGCGADASSQSDVGFVYIDGGVDDTIIGSTDGSSTESVPASCGLLRVVVSASVGCRADWTCAGQGLFTFLCSAADGGNSACYCIGPDSTQVPAPIDACSGGETGVQTAASTACGWSFAAPGASDGGGQ